jgi:hypothetical protein
MTSAFRRHSTSYVFAFGFSSSNGEGDFFYNGFRGGANFTLRDLV